MSLSCFNVHMGSFSFISTEECVSMITPISATKTNLWLQGFSVFHNGLFLPFIGDTCDVVMTGRQGKWSQIAGEQK